MTSRSPGFPTTDGTTWIRLDPGTGCDGRLDPGGLRGLCESCVYTDKPIETGSQQVGQDSVEVTRRDGGGLEELGLGWWLRVSDDAGRHSGTLWIKCGGSEKCQHNDEIDHYEIF